MLQCLPNDLLDLEDYVESGNVTFPYYQPPGYATALRLMGAFGSPVVDKDSGIVLDVPALKMAYFLGIRTNQDNIK